MPGKIGRIYKHKNMPDTKDAIKQRTETLITMTGEFCDQFLDQEFKALCEKMIRKMARKKTVPFMSGKIEIWAAAIVYVLARINFAFDKSKQPYTTPDEVCRHFGTNKTTTSQKAKAIHDMFKLHYWDDEFSTKEMQDQNPFGAFIDGFPVSIRSLPQEMRDVARQNPGKLMIWTMPPDTMQ